MDDVCSLSDEVVRYFSSKGPRTDVQVAMMDRHIKKERDKIRSRWSEDEKSVRAQRAGAVPRPVELVPLIQDFQHRKVKPLND
jgi:hypothetical protein